MYRIDTPGSGRLHDQLELRVRRFPLRPSARRGLGVAAAVTGLVLCGHLQTALAVTGGSPAGPGQDLENVAFLHPDGSLACEGSIISATAVVTSAACVDGEHGPVLAFRYGSHDDRAGGHIALIADRLVHPDYDPGTHDSDIAVVRPAVPLALDDHARPIRLPRPGDAPATGITAEISGWGAPTPRGDTPELRTATVPIVGETTCRDSYGDDGITGRMICAGLKEGGAESCQGDSGGPLATGDGSGGQVLTGITSWGYGCARPDFYGHTEAAPAHYGVYTRVSEFTDWIAKVS
ncbi:S1 family serine peptidase [Kitasatospora sp. NPDC101176]|uniref:S1 family serine peptidase n=1 Tax=Kitasatospora sp. NPDC101176 TaxID=3364099 RepID=UPI003805ADEA